ncbi:hypothetical protein BCR36DRAFT_394860 [Piromyces finnis]|uniref:Right handed beta helix domain-containing protein n=1 Tax=Piromyces finnis TaxID=1754191 RepID=A0A1Y1VJY2_9FUNG|nr:hypothetical protein BCR36DRAFT_394860 [Piromyces finnis]|eukprot:ORX58412.1 hypothetical protein BCR36DRAFT_394860 [Piromyces finnis]
MILFFIFLVAILTPPLVNAVVIDNESKFIDIFNSDEKEIVIHIESELLLNNELSINNTLEKLIIIGNSNDSSKIIINKEKSHQKIHFSQNIKQVELLNITVEGNLFFDNNKKILIENVLLSGGIDSNFEKNQNDYFKFKNFNYKTNEPFLEYCINLSGNVEIENSKFWGNHHCEKRIMKHKGNDIYSFFIKNSYFSGEYQSSCLEIENVAQVQITNSFFEKGYCRGDLIYGGSIYALSSKGFIKNCEFRDNFCNSDGGSFYFDSNPSFLIEDINIYNTTALTTVMMIFFISTYKYMI